MRLIGPRCPEQLIFLSCNNLYIELGAAMSVEMTQLKCFPLILFACARPRELKKTHRHKNHSCLIKKCSMTENVSKSHAVWPPLILVSLSPSVFVAAIFSAI